MGESNGKKNRIELAKERHEVSKGCKSEENEELKEIIEEK